MFKHKIVMGVVGSVLTLGMMTLLSTFVSAETTSTNTASTISVPQVKMLVQINAAGHAQLNGSVAAIQDNSFTVNSWGGVWTVNTGSAKLLRRFGGSSMLSEFAAGDFVMVTGKVNQSPWTIDASIVRNVSIQARNAAFSGTVSNVNGNSFAFTTKARGNVNVTLNTDAKIVVNGQSGSVSGIANSMIGTISGVWDRSRSTVLASKVNLRTPKVRPSVTGKSTATTTPASQ